VLHYGLNKNHPYADGNKRLALTAMISFLRMNGFVVHASSHELLDVALRVAGNDMSRGESAEFIVQRASRLTWSDARTDRWVRSLPDDVLDAVDSAVNSDEAGGFDRLIRWRMGAIGELVRSLREEVAPYVAS
jgi:hypothetical protein